IYYTHHTSNKIRHVQNSSTSQVFYSPFHHTQNFIPWMTDATSLTLVTCTTCWGVRKVLEHELPSPAVFPLHSAQTPDNFNRVATNQSQLCNEFSSSNDDAFLGG